MLVLTKKCYANKNDYEVKIARYKINAKKISSAEALCCIYQKKVLPLRSFSLEKVLQYTNYSLEKV